VELFNFFRLMLAVIATVTIAWPVNIPFAALAYKVRLGQGTNPLEPRAFWTRSTFAALGLAGMSLVLLGIDYALAKQFEFPPGPVHLFLFMVYVPVAVWYLFVLYAMEDLLQALGVFVLYIFLPGLPLLLIDQVFDFRQPLSYALAWLPPVLA
jgi:hypothetical protein